MSQPRVRGTRGDATPGWTFLTNHGHVLVCIAQNPDVRIAEIADLVRTIGKVAEETGAAAQGYRLLANTGKRAGQEVPHLHFHLFGGQPLGPMLSR